LAFNTGSDPPRIRTRVCGPPRALVCCRRVGRC
jgi:hypothetical protein